MIIVGFAAFDGERKNIYEYQADGKTLTVTTVQNISPYLVSGSDFCLVNRQKPLCQAPEMRFGSMPRDGGHLILSDDERDRIIRREPQAAKYIRPYTGAHEFINGGYRWCLWLVDASPEKLRMLPIVLDRVEKTKKFRLDSKAAATRKFAATPTLFCQIAQPDNDYLLVPRVSSERRRYLPIGFVSRQIIANDQTLLIPNAKAFHFGVLSSAMHMAWVRQLGGRLKSDFRYSKDILYNNFPWPGIPTTKQRASVEKAAQAVLDARAKFPDATLADLYDPLSMPPALVKAHSDLDRAVDLCYRPQPFENDRQRVEFLFALYEKLTAPLLPASKPARQRRPASRKRHIPA